MSVEALDAVFASSKAPHPSARLVLLALARHCNHRRGDRVARPSIPRLSRMTGLSCTQVRHWVRELERIGELEIISPGGGRGRPHRYRILLPGKGTAHRTLSDDGNPPAGRKVSGVENPPVDRTKTLRWTDVNPPVGRGGRGTEREKEGEVPERDVSLESQNQKPQPGKGPATPEQIAEVMHAFHSRRMGQS